MWENMGECRSGRKEEFSRGEGEEVIEREKRTRWNAGSGWANQEWPIRVGGVYKRIRYIYGVQARRLNRRKLRLLLLLLGTI